MSYKEAVEKELKRLTPEERAHIELAAGVDPGPVDLWVFGEVQRELELRRALQLAHRARRWANGHIIVQRAADGVTLFRY